MKKFFKIAALLLVTAFAMSLIACGNGGYVDPELPKDYVIEPRGKIKVSMYLRSGNASEIALDNWINGYKRLYPDVSVRKDIIEWAQFPIQVAAGDIGDVYYSADVDVYHYAVKEKAAMALDSYIENLDVDISKIYSGVYELGCANGLLYMVPSDISESVFYANISLLNEKGLTLPEFDWTWDDFREYCSKVREVNPDGTFAKMGCFFESNISEAFTLWLYGWGGEWIDTINKKVSFYTDEKVLRGVYELIDMIEKGYAGTMNLTGEIGAKYANLQDPADYAFKFGLHYGVLWQDRIVLMESYKTLGLDMNVTTVPETPTRTVPGEAFGYIVYSKTKNPDASATFVLYLLSDDGQRAFNNIVGGGMPCTKEGIEAGYWRIPFDEDEFNYDAFIAYPDAFKACWPQCYTPPEIADVVEKYLPTLIANHFSNKRDYTDTLSLLEKECNEKWMTIFD